ncbi:thioesterase II family protein [Nocardia altamirensis]|uniref:thioesterase II family protein n=1 Tax=Nocardia altamirensis TaxID=472158 RepID=UPI0008400380|nr:alpha/beta fold hydrolase [Nocardia altamirensis]
MQHRPTWIRQFHRPNSPERLPLLIFPHAGAGASAYRAFSKAFSASYDVAVVQYPGRQDRVKEPAPTSLHEIAAGAFTEFQTSPYNRGVPITTFGHSMGALVSFEFARLAEVAGITVRQLTISAAVAPSRAVNQPRTPKEDDQLLAHLAKLEGTNTAVFGNPEVMKMTLPVIKSDHAAAEAYSCDESVKISARVHAICGDNDPIVTMSDLYGWRSHSADVDVTIFEGGHFYLNDHVDAIAELLAANAEHEQTA